MLKKTAPTTNPFTGEERTEVMYFNFTSTELRDLLVRNQNLLATAEKLRDGETTALESWDFLTKMVQYSYGKRTESDDFLKSQDIRNSFVASDAYDHLMTAFLEDAGAGVEFVQSIMPVEALEAARREQERQANAGQTQQAQQPTEGDTVVTRPDFRPQPQDYLPPQAPVSRREAREQAQGYGEGLPPAPRTDV